MVRVALQSVSIQSHQIRVFRMAKLASADIITWTACCRAHTLTYTPVCSCSCMHVNLRGAHPLVELHEFAASSLLPATAGTSSVSGTAAASNQKAGVARCPTACQLKA